jgi:uncharacterized protein YjbI with pentapeptide repeats
MNDESEFFDDQEPEPPSTNGDEPPQLREVPENVATILEEHRRWMQSKKANKKEGKRANIENARLAYVDLAGNDLRMVVLQKAYLYRANLRGADLRDADLRNADLYGADLHGAKLDNANLEGANIGAVKGLNKAEGLTGIRLEGAKGLLGMEFAGKDVTGAKLPEDIAEFKALDHVTEISKHARNIFLAVIGGCVFSWLTIATTTDAALLTNTVSTPLPIIQTKVPIAGFYWAAPAILLALYFYLHLYLQRMWEGLAGLPAIFPDGRTVDQRAYPWLLSGLVRAHVPLLRKNRPSMSRLQVGISMIAARVLVPLTLFAFWLRYLPRHEWPGIFYLIVTLLVSIWAGVTFYRLARATLRAETTDTRSRYLMLEGIMVSLFAIITAAISLTATNRDTRFRLIGYTTFADLRYADVSTKPANWSGKYVDIGSINGADLKNKKLRFALGREAFLVKADLRRADLREANFVRTNLVRAKLQGANLQGADLREANLRETNLERAILVRAVLPLANLQGANLNGAKLQGANLKGAKLQGAHLEGSNVTQEQLDKACGDGNTKLPPGLTIKPCPEKEKKSK